MKRKITKFLAAFALLVFIAPSMVAWGQNDGDVTVTWTATAANNFGATIGSVNSSNTGTISTGDFVWNYTNTLTYLKTSKSDYQAFSNGFIQIGSSNAYHSLVLTTSGFTNTIKSVSVECSSASGAHKLTVTVGSVKYIDNQNTPSGAPSSSGNYTMTGTGTSTGDITISFVPGSGALYIKSISVTYEDSNVPSLLDSDLALVNAPVALTFDLYNNASAQVISYTTSSTGAVSVETSDYITAEVDETEKTITITPVAMTNGAQTITVNQAADETYEAGSVEFTVTITDSTPFTGGDVTFNAAVDKGTSPLVKNGVTFACDNGILNNGSEYRLYKNSTTTFSVEEGTITQIVFTGVSGNPASGFATQTGWTTDGNNGTWTGNATSVSFVASGAQVRATQIVVTVDLSGAPDPIITANNVNIAYNATEGEITYAIENPVDGATLEAVVATGATITNFTLGTVGASPITFTCDANNSITDNTATVTLNYVKNGETLATKDVTVTQAAAPVIYTTIPDLFAVATSTSTPVTVTFGGWVVTGVNGNQVFVTDGTNGFIIYQSGHGFVVGNTLTGTASCNLVLFNGSAEITGLTTSTEGLTVGTDGTVTPVTATIDNLSAVNTGSVVTLNNLTYNGSVLSDGTNSITPYSTLYSGTFENGKTYNVTGVFVLNNTTKRILPRSAEDIEEVVLPVINADNVTIAYNATSGIIAYTIDNAVSGTNLTASSTANWISDITVGTESVNFNTTVNDGNSDRYATITLSYGTVTKDVTVTQGHLFVPATGNNYELFSGDLVEGEYLIVYNGKAMNNVVEGNRLQYVEVTANDNDVIVLENAEAIWHISPSGDYWTIYNAEANAYAAATGSKNQAQMLANGSDDKALWTVTGNETYDFENKARAVGSDPNNKWLRNNTTYGFACYGSSTGGALSLYKRTNAYTPTLAITGYGESTGGYVLIASPVSTTAAAAGMITDNLGASATPETSTYDLYSFDQSEADEWRNYRASNFDIEPAKGYLYASKNGVTLTFQGTSYNGDGTISLTYTQGEGIDFPGLNLVGNPFANETTFAAYDWETGDVPELNFLTMNSTGDGFISTTATSFTASAMQGFFVQATNSTQQLQLEEGGEMKTANLNIAVSRNRGNVIDNAIVNFGNASMMNKFYLKDNTTRVYIPQGNREMAVVRSAAEAEMPVSFKASENGTYTLAVETENVEMNYLHLIDNLTGMDVDLLQTPSYTFEAKTSDYASRFRLVFKASSTSSEADETFAYFNGTSWTVSNLGEATLQVVDVTGRTVSSETINGNATISLNQTPGVYMLRLVNGNSVKVQKVVVR